VGQVLLRELN